jgi:signal transduction histidine kinase
MELKRRNTLIYALLLGVWVLVVAWQIEEHSRVQEAARVDLRNRSTEIGNTLSAVMRALRFRGSRTVLQQQLEPVLDELVNGRTNELANSGGLIAIALLNTNGEPFIALGNTNVIPGGILAEGEYWTNDSVTFVNPIEGASVLPPPPPPGDFTNGLLGFQRTEPSTNDANSANAADLTNINLPATNAVAENSASNQPLAQAAGNRRGGPGRPRWLRFMSPAAFSALIAQRELHGLVITMSTENFQAISTRDLWLRGIIILFAGISAAGIGLARRNTIKTSDLQLRLVRASELNSHLKELNLAAAGLAHETRNPLNIIRGQAQMISRLPEAAPEVREKSRTIVDETDKVTAQLTEFINYSRPREVRRTRVDLALAANEIVRTLGLDIEEKKLHVEVRGDTLVIQADEQLLRQVLFNLLINAIQAANPNGNIQIIIQRAGPTEAVLEVRDDGPGVLAENRREIFKPYFTTHQKGTGLGLAVVQQIVLAHGWEITCAANEPRGAVFRITHLKIAA